jgi:hypothetical protein
MSSVVVVVSDVIGHEPFQMPNIQSDHMAEQIAMAVADEALGDAVLPRAAEAGSLWLNAFTASITSALNLEARSRIR